MKYTPSALLASVGLSAALTQQCTGGSAVNEGGNWFCGSVNQIIYQGIRGNGGFQAVTDMSSTGKCLQEHQRYDGPLAPLDQGLSLHFRGPLHLKQFAVYNLASSRKRDQVAPGPDSGNSDNETQIEQGEPSNVSARQKHGHRFIHRALRAERADIVTATIYGKVVTWENNYFGGAATSTPASPPAATLQTGAAIVDTDATSEKPSATKASDKPTETLAPPRSDWDRVAYYNAEKQESENVVFMGNHGGQGSGVFDTVWGLSLAYLNSKGNGGAPSPQILQDVQIPSNQEFSIFSAEKCGSDCGFSRVPELAYKGFGGPTKAFLFEFKMPSDGTRCPPGTRPGFQGCANPDMPAIWALNAAIPRTAQYNGCSCWVTGCGEVDIYEVLAPGDTKCKSSFHMANGAGSSDYFERPVDRYVKVAIVFHGETATVSIQKLADHVAFSKGLDGETVSSWLGRPTDKTALTLSSLFQLAS
ncbi:hypothetical protein NOR_02524 [Metarhizium rileyi]|uniref:glucan endo-1,3-beta-D-glucosidase n=1 Tax=Metarhizium rileyi (strain RCEF 4871) TaxID=1649241 RepID=A0A162JNT0_METRR|nr:hypothetical protein NOR_02524 [Metarhizium rileyi RCEF 4871]